MALYLMSHSIHLQLLCQMRFVEFYIVRLRVVRLALSPSVRDAKGNCGEKMAVRKERASHPRAAIFSHSSRKVPLEDFRELSNPVGDTEDNID